MSNRSQRLLIKLTVKKSTHVQDELANWLLEQTSKPENINPCIRAYGRGPEDAKCKTCALLRRKHYAKTYIKCSLRRDTNGPGTDHKANWPACGKYQNASVR